MFEFLCIRDLRIYAEAFGGKVYHYPDKSGLECGAVVVLRDGRWGAVEIKLGSNEFEKAAKNLMRLSEIVDHKKMNKTMFLMILTGTKLGYKREDGVLIVPVACLKD